MPGGRPTKLDAEAANAIVAILQKGLPIDDACAAAGISDTTFQRWMRKGEAALKARNPKPEAAQFREFCTAVKKARSMGKVSNLQIIENAARGTGTTPGSWQAAAWLLERMFPHQFGRKIIRLEATPIEEAAAGNGGAPVAQCNLIMEGPIEPPGPVIIELDDDEESTA